MERFKLAILANGLVSANLPGSKGYVANLTAFSDPGGLCLQL